MSARKPLLILDIDETLVFASESEPSRPADLHVGPYHVLFRPGLESFLLEMDERFRLAIWSSSSDAYATQVAAAIRPQEVEFEFVWGRSRCTLRLDLESHRYYWAKKLDKVERRGFDKRRMLIVDNTPAKVRHDYGNAVYVDDFEGDPEDRELSRLARYLLDIHATPNFRTLEKRGWRNRY